MLTFGSLCTGFGGMDLGLERSGLKCAWQVEIMNMQDECSINIGPECEGMTTCEHSQPPVISSTLTIDVETAGCTCGTGSHASRAASGPESICLPLVILAKRTAEPALAITSANRASALNASASLMHLARALYSARIRPTRERMLPGLGGDSGLALNRLVTLCCPSDCERVVLGLSTNGTDCSCSVSAPTPTASDWRGGKRKRKAGTQANLRDVFTQTTGWLYMPPEALEAAQGFPPMWSELPDLATPSIPTVPSGSASESSSQ